MQDDEVVEEGLDDDNDDDGLLASSSSLATTASRRTAAAPFDEQKICGFTFNFSNMVPGMLYRSRNDPRGMASWLLDGSGSEDAADAALSSSSSSAASSSAVTSSTATGKDHHPSILTVHDDEQAGFAQDAEDAQPETLDLRQRMALTLRNWCLDEANIAMIAKEGAIQALAALASREDRLTRRYCTAAFYLLSRNPAFRWDLVQVGACAIVAQVALNTKHPHVALTCASSLCNLSLEPGVEARLAEEGAVGALCTLLLTFPDRAVWATSLQGLYNLTCVTESYAGLDRVLKGLLSTYDTPCQDVDPSPVVGLAVSNLSVIPRMRLRILEEGLLDVAARHLLPFADGTLRYHVVVALHNMASARACRGEMINKGVLACLLTLTRPPASLGKSSKDHNEQQPHPTPQELLPLLDCLARTLQYLSLEVETRAKTIQDGAVKVVLNILEQTAEPSVLQACAEALHAFSSFGDCCALLLKHQAVPALVKLSETLLHAKGDNHQQQQRRRQCHSVVASFCNLLSAEAHHGLVLDHKGALACVLQLAECLGSGSETQTPDEVLLDYLSCLYSNLACGAPRRFQAVMAGLVPRLVQLCDVPQATPAVSTKLKARCATALANLMAITTTSSSSNDATSITTTKSNTLILKRMVQDGVVGCLARLLDVSTDEALLESVTTALALTSFHHHDVKAEILQQGIVHALIRTVAQGVLRGDKTQHAAAAIFASLSFSPQHIPHLFAAGVLDAVFVLAKTEETATRKRCATVLCNLSYDPHVRNHMVERNVVLLLAQLSNTYSDEMQMDCAWCFCNLSCYGDAEDEEARTLQNRATMVQQGAVGALLMIALVRAVTTQTREVCARALLNLITEETTAQVVKDGITQGLASLCGLDSEDCLHFCAQAFWTLSHHAAGRAKIASKRNIMQGLCSLVRSGVATTRTLCGATVLNLLLLETETAVRATDVGALAVVKVMCTSGDAAIQVQCARAVAKIAPLATCRERMPKESIPQAMVLLAQQNQDEATAVTALRALACLTLFQFPLAVLSEAGILHVVIYRVLTSVFVERPREAGGDPITTTSSSTSSNGKDVVEACVHILYRFAQSKELRLALAKTQVVCAAVVLLRRLGEGIHNNNDKAQASSATLLLETMLATTLERLSWIPASQHHIVEDGGMQALVELLKRRHDARGPQRRRLAKSLAITFANLARAETHHLHLVTVGAIGALAAVIEQGLLQDDGDGKDVVMWRVALGMLQLSESSDELVVAMALSGALELLVFIVLSAAAKVVSRGEVLQRYAAGALCNFSRCHECRPLLVAQEGAMEALMALSKSTNTAIQRSCSIMFANLSGQHHTQLRAGSVGTLVYLFKAQDRHERTAAPAAAARGTAVGGKNKKGAIQAKFRRLLMAATLAKELNDGTKGAGAGAEGTISSGAEAVSAEQKTEEPEDMTTAGEDHEGHEEEEEDGGSGGGDKGPEEEEKDRQGFYSRATQHTTAKFSKTSLLELVGPGTQQQKASLASWDMTPPAHKTIFYKCSQFVSTTAATTTSSPAEEGNLDAAAPATTSSTVAAPSSSSSSSSFPAPHAIALNHPKLSEFPALRSRQTEKSNGATTAAAAFLLERRKDTRLKAASLFVEAAAAAAVVAKEPPPPREARPPTSYAEKKPHPSWGGVSEAKTTTRSPLRASRRLSASQTRAAEPASPPQEELPPSMSRLERVMTLAHAHDDPLPSPLPPAEPKRLASSSSSSSSSRRQVQHKKPSKPPQVDLALLQEALAHDSTGVEHKKTGGAGPRARKR